MVRASRAASTAASSANGDAATTASFSTDGIYTLRLTADDGDLAAFDELIVTVEPVPNQPPSVNAGPDVAVTLPAAASLSATVTDDGLPAGSVTHQWSKVGGPGRVTFASPTSTATTASFSTDGIYTLRLTVDDGELTAFDELVVTVEPVPNEPPSVNAGPDVAVTLPAAASLTATVTDDGLPAGSVTHQWSKVGGPGTVTFASPTSTATTASFSTDGIYTLRLTADDGELAAFDELVVTVAPIPNQPPSVDAGPDRSITLPASVSLVGTIGDDGLPAATLTASWSKTGGPGVVTFTDPAALTTTATFSTDGTYTLRLTADDGALAAFDELVITVAPVPNEPPSVDAGPDQAITLPATATLVGTINDDGLPAGSVTSLWSKVAGPGSVTFADAAAASTTASFSSDGTYTLRLTADDGEFASLDELIVTVGDSPRVLAGLQALYTFDQRGGASVADVSGIGAALDLTIENGGRVTRTDTALNLEQVTRISNPADGSKIFQGAVASGELTAEAWIVPATDAQSGPARIVTLSADPLSRNFTIGQDNDVFEIRLRTTETDDNGTAVRLFSPPSSAGARLTHVLFTRARDGNAALYVDGVLVDTARIGGDLGNWDDAYDFALGNEFDTDSTNPARAWLGEYHLVAVYSRALSAAEVVRNYDAGVAPDNQAPDVNAGADQSITLPADAVLNATVTDDGLPTGSVAALWSRVSGPGTVSFADPAATTTSASFSGAGTYVLRLTADDGELTASDDVTVTVAPVPNLPPIVSAGPDVAVVLPDAAALNGSASDDGLPSGTLDVTWTQRSGPGAVTFSAPQSAVTAATFPSAGTYVLRLTADDSLATAFDEVVVSVAPPANRAPVVDAGPDLNTTLPDPITLGATVSDDGLPGGNLTYQWSQTSGPGTAFFGRADSIEASVDFDNDGTYVLRLTADDGELTAFDEINVTVAPSPRVRDGLVALYPFDRRMGNTVRDISRAGVELPLLIEDRPRTTRTGDGLRIDDSTRLSNPTDGNKIFNAAVASGELTVEAWIVPDSASQDGPARVVTLSSDPFSRNFTIGQDNDTFEVRVRTTNTDDNGTTAPLFSPPGSAAPRLTHVLFTFDGTGRATLYIDGARVSTATIGGDFSNWDPTHDFGLANEFSAASTDPARDWRGEYRLLAVYSRALSQADVLRNFQAGP